MEVMFQAPEPATPPMIVVDLEAPAEMTVAHEVVREDYEQQESECACGLKVQGPEYKSVMTDHILVDGYGG